MADKHMRKLIGAVPDGTYNGMAIVEDAGHGLGDLEINAQVTIKGETCQQVPVKTGADQAPVGRLSYSMSP